MAEGTEHAYSLGNRPGLPRAVSFWARASSGMVVLFVLGAVMESEFEPVVTFLLSGRMTGMNHARHLAIARVLKTMEHGRELMHLGLQVCATRAGHPEKYDRALTDWWWERVDGEPSIADFGDVVGEGH